MNYHLMIINIIFFSKFLAITAFVREIDLMQHDNYFNNMKYLIHVIPNKSLSIIVNFGASRSDTDHL